jgi:lysophospholipase L1-like esterase
MTNLSDTIWATAWTGSVQGPYPAGIPSAQPDQRFAFPDPAIGARDQSFRLIIRPDIWGTAARLRFSNVLGARPLHLDGVYAGLQQSGSGIVAGTNQPVRFDGAAQVTIPPGAMVWSDAVPLSFVDHTDNPLLRGRRMGVSFHVVGESGPMTWHGKALTTSYLTPPGAGAHGGEELSAAFPFTTASWFFLDAVDMRAEPDTRVVVAFGDSITDGTFAAMNTDDRWADVLSRRLHAMYGPRVSVVNAGIGGNQIISPATYSPQAAMNADPAALARMDRDILNLYGGPSALARLDRDVLSLSAVSTIIWLEGTNDLGISDADPAAVIAGISQGVRRMRAGIPDVRVIGGTLTSAVNATLIHGRREVEAKRQTVNRFIRSSGLFDAIADFDAATLDPATGELRAEFQPNGTLGGDGDRLHPNHAGYLAMAYAIDLATLFPPASD